HGGQGAKRGAPRRRRSRFHGPEAYRGQLFFRRFQHRSNIDAPRGRPPPLETNTPVAPFAGGRPGPPRPLRCRPTAVQRASLGTKAQVRRLKGGADSATKPVSQGPRFGTLDSAFGGGAAAGMTTRQGPPAPWRAPVVP